MAVIGNTKKQDSLLGHLAMPFIVGLFVALTIGACQGDLKDQETFVSPDKAVTALVKALTGNGAELSRILGPGSEDFVSSGDPVADQAERDRFIKRFEQKNKLEEVEANKVVLYVGQEDWPFTIPIVKKDGVWYFDTHEGREEILARRIGRNELSVIQTCLAYVDAQREYALKVQNKVGIRAYAQKFKSDPDKKNGLYWKTEEGEEQSPLGPLMAKAQEDGYTGEQMDAKLVPYYGYYYRILKAQGESAPGGAYDYVVKGDMIGGFALVSHPARYGYSGIMTFIVNHDGLVYQKDLGDDTTKISQAMTLFNPDSTWEKIKE